MKELESYICKYCIKEFEPKRRRVQKYCSDTCRSKAFHARKTNKELTTKSNDIGIPNNQPTPPSQKMSTAGVGNVVAGVLAINAAKAIFTKEHNKPATKGDLKALSEKLQGRYHLVKNLQQNSHGQLPYFDLEMNIVVYLKVN
ncbi:hypothetical protein [Winogradskyella sp. UBA3174]|uniref:hypothetical protein n=1 Tax=Winogradskyella sp. UBA3174 TaxID=1947785 RepID=UPI0025FA4374|nr:hypothetical protein [Winogradskyella sp. UBA3174]|tara:strand:+ start:103900 stop:104328 length:429 start_codon:yes stop_codon:yes gene_type:complete